MKMQVLVERVLGSLNIELEDFHEYLWGNLTRVRLWTFRECTVAHPLLINNTLPCYSVMETPVD